MTICWLLVGSAAVAAEVSFLKEVAPILQAQCLTCHRATKAKGDYRLDTFERLLKAGSSGEASIVPGAPERSRLVTLLEATDPDDRMPQDAEPLGSDVIGLIRRWVREGARYDGPDPAVAWDAWLEQEGREAPERYPRPLAVTALAWSPDGGEIAVSGYHEVRIHTADGRLARRIGRMPSRIMGLAWSGDGRWIAVAGGDPGRSGRVLLAEARSGDVSRVAAGSDLFLSVAFSPDSARLAAGGADNSVSVFDVASGRRLLQMPSHADWVLALAWSPDGARLASGSRDRTARVADARTGEAETAYTEHGAAVTGVGFAPDGKWAWSAGRDRKLRAWDVTNAEGRRTLSGWDADPVGMLRSGDWVWGWSADVLLGFDKGEAGRRVQIPGTDWTAVAADGAGARIATGTADGRVRVYSVSTEPKELAGWVNQ